MMLTRYPLMRSALLILLAASEYAKLRDFYQQVAAADPQQVVLARAQAAK